jgi:hypothetical protein
MKVLALSLSLLASFSVMSMPTVGDKATYQISMSGVQFESTIELTAFNEATQMFTQTTTTSLMGQTTSDVEEVSIEDLNSDAELDAALSSCQSAEVGGVLESVTVAAGTFDTCKITNESGTVNMGKVPFGVVKMEASAEGMPVNMELKSFSIAE